MDYPLAPEHPFPADKLAVWEACLYLQAHAEFYHCDVSRLAIGGQSAGGNIAAAICLMAIQQQKSLFACQVLNDPPLDIHTPAQQKPCPPGCIPVEQSRFFDDCYRLESQSTDPLCSPIFAEDAQLAQLPPALIISGENDSLCNEQEAYAMRLLHAGVEITARRFSGIAHGYPLDSSVGQRALSMVTDFLHRHLLA